MASTVDFAPQQRFAPEIRRGGRSRDAQKRRSVARLVEHEVIPRLLLLYSADSIPPETGAPVAENVIGADAINEVAQLSCLAEPALLFDRIDELAALGHSPETLFIELLAPAARLLGTWWEDDTRDFTEVTIGLWRLQEVVRIISARTPPVRWPVNSARRALFAAMPGDQHSFGTVLVAETFTRGGWQVELATEGGTSQLLARVAGGSFDIAGLTVSCDSHIERISLLIQGLRSVSHNPRLRVLVGGRIFVANPALAMQVGADGTADDAQGALQVAEEMVERTTGVCASLV